MKQKDLTLIIVVVIFATVFALLVSNFVFSSPKTHNQKVPVVEKITSNFPDTKQDSYQAFFNAQALNPTVLIQIDTNNNATPIGTPQTH
jgi:uncharacterized protein with FMN-binding domain